MKKKKRDVLCTKLGKKDAQNTTLSTGQYMVVHSVVFCPVSKEH